MTLTMPIDQIEVEGRRRRDLGDLSALAESINRVGLLHPLVVTEAGRLVAGQRRLEACRLLGWDGVPVTVATDLADVSALLAAERDENTCRLDMTRSEQVALGMELEKLERPRANKRRQAAGVNHGRGIAPDDSSEAIARGSTRDIVSSKVGVSHQTYVRAKAVVEAAEKGEPGAVEARDAMDKSGNVSAAFRAVKDSEPERETRSAPRLDTTRGRQVANKRRDRVWGLVSNLPDSDSLVNFDVGPALSVATDEDKDHWVRMIGDSIEALRKLQTQIQKEA